MTWQGALVQYLGRHQSERGALCREVEAVACLREAVASANKAAAQGRHDPLVRMRHASVVCKDGAFRVV